MGMQDMLLRARETARAIKVWKCLRAFVQLHDPVPRHVATEARRDAAKLNRTMGMGCAGLRVTNKAATRSGPHTNHNTDFRACQTVAKATLMALRCAPSPTDTHTSIVAL